MHNVRMLDFFFLLVSDIYKNIFTEIDVVSLRISLMIFFDYNDIVENSIFDSMSVKL